MNLMENYARAMRPFMRPYISMMEAYAGFLKQVGSRTELPQPAETSPPGPGGSAASAPRRAQAFAVTRDVAKKEPAPLVEPAPMRSAKKVGITHSAAAERAKRSWATRRANAAEEEKAARKAARQKSRARKV
jgi:hypothetical protein